MSMWEPFTEEGRNAMVAAQEIAQAHRDNFINQNHLFFALARNKSITETLAALDVSAQRVAEAENAVLSSTCEDVSQEMTFTPEAKRLVELAFERSRELGTHFIGVEHLMLGFLSLGKPSRAIVDALAIDVEKFKDLLVQSLASQPKTISGQQSRTRRPTFENIYDLVIQKQNRERTDSWKNVESAVTQKDLSAVLANALAVAAEERLTPDEVLSRIARFIR
jgi:ATP-dependent Clp protease ATP-binding subunit ClpA